MVKQKELTQEAANPSIKSMVYIHNGLHRPFQKARYKGILFVSCTPIIGVFKYPGQMKTMTPDTSPTHEYIYQMPVGYGYLNSPWEREIKKQRVQERYVPNSIQFKLIKSKRFKI